MKKFYLCKVSFLLLLMSFILLTPSFTKAGISSDPGSVDFGSVNINSSSDVLVITITNTGSIDLNIDTLTITGTNDTEFSIEAETCTSAPIAPSGNCTAEIVFSPATEGAKSANLSVSSDDPVQNPFDVPLTGTGINATQNISVTPTSKDFGEVGVGGFSEILTVTILNNGTGNLTLGELIIDGIDSTEFIIETDNCLETILAPSENCTAEVDFWPESEGVKSANLSIPSDDPDENPVNVPLTGQGVILPSDIDVAPTSIDFGSVNVDETSDIIDVNISNTGAGGLNIEEISITGLNKLQFSIEDDECSYSVLAPTESCIVSVAFWPTSGGEKQAKLTIPSDDSDESPVNVSLTGIGVAPCGDNPQITKLGKQAATYAEELTITGSGFCEDWGTVFLSGIEADNIVSWSDSEIVVTVPWGLKNEDIKVKAVTAAESESNVKTFKFVKPPAPKITGLSSKSGKIGSEIEIIGTNFGNEDEGSKVMFGKVEAVDVIDWSNESITVKVPEISVKKKRKVLSIKGNTIYGKSNSKKFKVLP